MAGAADVWSFWNELVACGRDVDRLLDLITRRAATIVGEGAVLAVVRPGTNIIEPAVAHHPEEAIAELMRRALPKVTEVGVGIAGQAVADRAPVVLNNFPPDVVRSLAQPSYHDFHDAHPVRSIVIVPMIAFGEAVGALGVFRSRSSEPYGDADVRALEALAERAALALADARGKRDGGEPVSYEAIFRHSTDGVLLTAPDGRVHAANPAACEILQRSEREICALGRGGLVVGEDPRAIAAERVRRATGRVHAELPMIRGDGSVFIADVASTVFAGPNDEVRACVIFRDVSEQVALREELQQKTEALARLAEEDELTRVRNRRGYFEAARQALAFADRERVPVQLVFFDVDNLKGINDAHGHGIGDQVLQHVGAAIAGHARTIDIVARIGGDEFVALLYGATTDEARQVIARIDDALARSDDGLPIVHVTSGMASRAPDETITLEDLMSLADDRMYDSRRGGRPSP